MWYLSPTKGVTFSAADSTMDSISNFKSTFILGMPLYQPDPENRKHVPGDIIYDVLKNEIQFHGSPYILKLGEPKDKTKILKLAKAKAAAQKQRIRILELERAA